MRKQRSADRPVWRGESAADWPRKAVHRPQASVGQRQAAEQTRERHVLPGGWGRAFMKSCPEGARDSSDAFATKGFGHWVRARRYEWLDQLGQRVKAGAGSDGGRKIIREFWVDQGNPCQQVRAAQADFDLVLG